MDKIGNVAGPLLGYAVLSLFLLKSCFLGVMLFGQRRVSDTAHTLAVLMVAVGQLVAIGWLVALHSWMQTPDGAAVINGRYQVYDWLDVIFNPSFFWSLALTLLESVLAAAFLVMGVTALQMLRRPPEDGERLTFRVALTAALTAALLTIPAFAGLADLMARHQPAKVAALAGYWHTGAPPKLVLSGWPDEASESNLREVISFPAWDGRGLARASQDGVLGLDTFAGARPPVALVFWSLRVAILLFLLMLAAAMGAMLLAWRRGAVANAPPLPAWYLRFLVGMSGSGGLAAAAGWWVSLAGLQPYVVNRGVMLSDVLGPASPAVLSYGMAGYAALYAALSAAFAGMLLHAARYGVVPVRKGAGGLP
jgi:cytochrome d ubiquinol oxidase subunit I